MLVDSHSCLFLEEFTEDLPSVMERTRVAGVTYIFMFNINNTTVKPMLSVCDTYRDFRFPTIRLHPTSVNNSYEKGLEIVASHLATSGQFVAAGEIGIDPYWDKTWLKEQLVVFERQVQWALQHRLPIVVHCHEAFDHIYKVLQPYKSSGLTGISHSFAGTSEEATRMMEFSGFKISINGVATFKKSTLPEALKHTPLERTMLETDPPYLTPVPNCGRRDESTSVKDTLIKVAEICKKNSEKAAELTVISALRVFGVLKQALLDFKLY